MSEMFATSSRGPWRDLATPADRLLGQILDALVGYSVPTVLLIAMELNNPGRRLGLLSGLVMLAGTAYILFSDGLENGQSLGKRVVGIAVIDERTGAPCTFAQSLARNLLMCLGFWDWIFIFGAKRQRLGDMAAGTLVVNRPRY